MKAYFIVLIVLGCLLALILYLFLRIRCEKKERKISTTSQESTDAATGDVEIGKGKGTNSTGSVKDGDMVILAGDGGRALAPVEVIADIGSTIGTENDDCRCCGCGGDCGGCGGGCGGCGGCGG
ncbi:keratin-associated protein 5-2-like [Chenopodium quinoa]|uniref:keratin-associated protein 5-2-like n=1 Tax=Chenopodium quinoa TaxID=63459 RepID=UPI000B77BB9A|nr:keratin-associated protein 5-2-like [Chenopodium quinoa]